MQYSQSLVSIVIPVYNCEKYLRECLNSIQKQTMESFECILVNDGSTDHSLQICQEYEGDKRFHVIDKQNNGVSSARNEGICSAKGTYICFIDSDDYISEDYLESMLNRAKNAQLVICGIALHDYQVENGSLSYDEFVKHPSKYIEGQYSAYVWNKLFERAIIEEHHLRFDEKMTFGEDQKFVCQYLKYTTTIECLSAKLYYYVTRENQAISRYHKNMWQNRKMVIKEILQLFDVTMLDEKEKMYLDYWIYTQYEMVAFHYTEKCTERSYRNTVLKDILRSVDSRYQYKLIKNNVYFQRNNKIKYLIWKAFGVNGVLISDKISRIIRR